MGRRQIVKVSCSDLLQFTTEVGQRRHECLAGLLRVERRTCPSGLHPRGRSGTVNKSPPLKEAGGAAGAVLEACAAGKVGVGTPMIPSSFKS